MTNRGKRRLAFQPTVYCCFALLLVTSACNQAPADTHAADESAIRDQDAQWGKTAAARDLDGTVAYYTDDAYLLPPNAPVATGKQAIRAVWASLLAPDVTLPPWEVTKVEVARSGDLGYVIGTYQMTTKDPHGGPPVTDRGKLVEVWKKQADGKWKTVADIFNSDLPLPAPPEPKKK
jgi:uncharacterized protein (TIGR02246 family)